MRSIKKRREDGRGLSYHVTHKYYIINQSTKISLKKNQVEGEGGRLPVGVLEGLGSGGSILLPLLLLTHLLIALKIL